MSLIVVQLLFDAIRLCLSISDFHPDTWNPAWSVGTILTGLLSFMVGDVTIMMCRSVNIYQLYFQLESSPTLGSIETSDAEARPVFSEIIVFYLNLILSLIV